MVTQWSVALCNVRPERLKQRLSLKHNIYQQERESTRRRPPAQPLEMKQIHPSPCHGPAPPLMSGVMKQQPPLKPKFPLGPEE